MPRREHTDDDKAAALAFYAANNGNLKRTARECAVPVNTLRAWVENEQKGRSVSTPSTPKKEATPTPPISSTASLAEKAAEAKRDLADILDDKVRLLLGAMNESLVADDDLKSVATALGITTDKLIKLRELEHAERERQKAREDEAKQGNGGNKLAIRSVRIELMTPALVSASRDTRGEKTPDVEPLEG